MLWIYKPMCRPAAFVDLMFAETLQEVLLGATTQVSTLEEGGMEDKFWITEVQLERGEEWKFEATVYQ
jgi:hypothetical protein